VHRVYGWINPRSPGGNIVVAFYEGFHEMVESWTSQLVLGKMLCGRSRDEYYTTPLLHNTTAFSSHVITSNISSNQDLEAALSCPCTTLPSLHSYQATPQSSACKQTAVQSYDGRNSRYSRLVGVTEYVSSTILFNS
jgi:hypothetical protein